MKISKLIDSIAKKSQLFKDDDDDGNYITITLFIDPLTRIYQAWLTMRSHGSDICRDITDYTESDNLIKCLSLFDKSLPVLQEKKTIIMDGKEYYLIEKK